MGVPVAISDGTLYIDVDTDTIGLAYNQEENKAILNTLSIDKTAKNEIEKALNNGKTVIVPEKSIQYYDWNGTS